MWFHCVPSDQPGCSQQGQTRGGADTLRSELGFKTSCGISEGRVLKANCQSLVERPQLCESRVGAGGKGGLFALR